MTPTSRPRRWRGILVGLLIGLILGVVLVAVLAPTVADMADRRLVLEPAGGHPSPYVMRFAPPSETAVADPAALAEAAAAEAMPKNIVLFIGDGMGFSHLAAARAALEGPDGRLFVESFPVSSWITTHSLERLYTDSAAGATAIATGRKTRPRMLSVTPEGERLETVAERARDAGKAIGLVTDSYLWDATPAAFAAHRDSRRDLDGIAADFAASGVDLFVGGEHPGFDGDDPGADAMAAFGDAGYTVARDWPTLRDASAGPLLGLLPHQEVARETPPSLAELTRLALRRLGGGSEGFFLMVETEETDTGAHVGHLEQVVEGIRALDEAVRVAVEFADTPENGPTLVLVTSDHETGGLALMAGREGQPLKVRWATGGHTAEPVPLLARGPGSGALAEVRDNAELGVLLMGLVGSPGSQEPEDSGEETDADR